MTAAPITTGICTMLGEASIRIPCEERRLHIKQSLTSTAARSKSRLAALSTR